MKLWIRRKTLDTVQNIESFVFTTAKNHIIDHLRKAKSNQKYKDSLVREINAHRPVALENLIYKDYTNQLDNILNELPPRQKEIFQLSRMNGLSHDEIASKLNISNKTVRNNLFEALQHIKSRINPETLSLIGFLLLCH